jgi:hypothetical protein
MSSILEAKLRQDAAAKAVQECTRAIGEVRQQHYEARRRESVHAMAVAESLASGESLPLAPEGKSAHELAAQDAALATRLARLQQEHVMSVGGLRMALATEVRTRQSAAASRVESLIDDLVVALSQQLAVDREAERYGISQAAGRLHLLSIPVTDSHAKRRDKYHPGIVVLAEVASFVSVHHRRLMADLAALQQPAEEAVTHE